MFRTFHRKASIDLARKDTKPPTKLTVTDLCQYVFCPESARLDFRGVPQNEQARQRKAKGKIAHEAWQKQEDRAPARESRIGLLVLLAAAVLILLAFIWALTKL